MLALVEGTFTVVTLPCLSGDVVNVGILPTPKPKVTGSNPVRRSYKNSFAEGVVCRRTRVFRISLPFLDFTLRQDSSNTSLIVHIARLDWRRYADDAGNGAMEFVCRKQYEVVVDLDTTRGAGDPR